MSMELILTLAIAAVEVGLIVLCRFRLKQPPNPNSPRILPYGAIIILLTFGFFLTAAHTVSLVTGKQLMPKTKQPGQMMR